MIVFVDFADSSFSNYFTRCFCCRIFLRDSIIFTKVDCLWMTNKQSCKQTKYLFLPALLPHTKSSTSRLAGNILFIFTSFIWFKISFYVWQMKLRFFQDFFLFFIQLWCFWGGVKIQFQKCAWRQVLRRACQARLANNKCTKKRRSSGRDSRSNCGDLMVVDLRVGRKI